MPLLIDNTAKGFYISHKYLVQNWIHESVIAKLYPPSQWTEMHNNRASNQSCENTEINSREKLQMTNTPNQLTDNR
jgi:hypothetical protein